MVQQAPSIPTQAPITARRSTQEDKAKAATGCRQPPSVVASDCPPSSERIRSALLASAAAPAHAQLPTTYTAGRELPINTLTELLRAEVAQAGYTEVLTW